MQQTRARGWTITRHQVVEALLGKQVVTLSRELDDVEDASSFDGHGSVVPFGPVGTSGSTKLAGSWIFDPRHRHFLDKAATLIA